MFRGFVPLETFQSGAGTQPSAKVFAKNGFITVAPDFLGYGESDKGSDEAFENRFQTYTTALSLISSINNLNKLDIDADVNKVGIWGHSNGGYIALAVLEASGGNYPTVLWAPVTKPFPYSVLYYTDEYSDNGKILRKLLSGFENDYDAEKFSVTNYFNLIKAPIQLHQGGADEEVPIWWSNEFTEKLKKLDINIQYFTYPNSDHNLRPDGWNTAVSRSVDFFKTNL